MFYTLWSCLCVNPYSSLTGDPTFVHCIRIQILINWTTREVPSLCGFHICVPHGYLPGGWHENPLQYSCLENPHGQRSLAGCSPWGRKEWDMTEHITMCTWRLALIFLFVPCSPILWVYLFSISLILSFILIPIILFLHYFWLLKWPPNGFLW